MLKVMDYPLLVFLVSFALLWLSTRVGTFLFRSRRRMDSAIRDDFGVILGASLTLLGLIIGFSFSMAVSRYDQRKNYEEAEANAIGTEYLRADLLPSDDSAKVRRLLQDYLDQRVLFYVTRNSQKVEEINRRTAQLQSAMWAALLPAAGAQPTPMIALAVSGMNDVLNSQGYTQAAWWNRIPIAAWALMIAIAICCCMLMGYGMRDVAAERRLLLVLPFVVSISFFLIADIDSPRGGVIRVSPHNLESLVDTLR